MKARYMVQGGVLLAASLGLASLGTGMGALVSDGSAATQSSSPSIPAVGSSEVAPAICGTPLNPYASSSSTLKACGFRQYPRQSTRTTSDGSTIYTYDVAGLTTTYTLPPASFDAATASATELAKYGIPPAPSASNVTAYAQWSQMVSNLHFVTPPGTLVSINARAGTSNNWSGYANSSNS